MWVFVLVVVVVGCVQFVGVEVVYGDCVQGQCMQFFQQVVFVLGDYVFGYGFVQLVFEVQCFDVFVFQCFQEFVFYWFGYDCFVQVVVDVVVWVVFVWGQEYVIGQVVVGFVWCYQQGGDVVVQVIIWSFGMMVQWEDQCLYQLVDWMDWEVVQCG